MEGPGFLLIRNFYRNVLLDNTIGHRRDGVYEHPLYYLQTDRQTKTQYNKSYKLTHILQYGGDWSGEPRQRQCLSSPRRLPLFPTWRHLAAIQPVVEFLVIDDFDDPDFPFSCPQDDQAIAVEALQIFGLLVLDWGELGFRGLSFGTADAFSNVHTTTLDQSRCLRFRSCDTGMPQDAGERRSSD